jgi:hypothetical protein
MLEAPVLTASLLPGLVATATPAWPLVQPVHEEFTAADGPNARVDLPIKDRRGRVLYRLECRTWLSGDGQTEFDYSGDFECRLVATVPDSTRSSWNLLSDVAKPTRDWEHRGRFLHQQLVGECLSYPGWEPRREFRLRGFRLTLSLSDWVLDPPPRGQAPSSPALKRFRVGIDLAPDPTASGAYAAPSGWEQPRCLGDGPFCEALDCRAKGSK